MISLETSALPQPQEALLDVYTRFQEVAIIKPDTRFGHGPRAQLRAASMLISNSCVLRNEGYEERAQEQIDFVALTLDELKGTMRPGDYRFATTRLLGHVVTMLQHPSDLDIFNQERRAINRVNLAEIRRVRQYIGAREEDQHMLAYRKKHGDAIGEIAEIAIPALVERYNSPYVMALPALPHNDFEAQKGEHPGSFDSILIESLPSSEGQVYRTQTKNRCLSLCDESEGGNITALTKTRTKYRNDIHLTSGHCDLGIYLTEEGYQLPLIDALIRETKGRAAPEDVALLDMATNNLLLEIPDDTMRRCFLPQPASIALPNKTRSQ